MRSIIRLTAATGGALLGSMMLAVTALGHAELLRTAPRDGQVLERSPRTVVLTFDEAIDPGLVRLQVSDADGRSVDRGEAFHLGGREEIVAVRLEPGLAGRYVARFRVISEDGHPVARRLSFLVPPKPADDEAAAQAGPDAAPPPEPSPMPEEERMHADTGAGDVTEVGFAAARALGYLAIALAIGGTLFMFVAWLPALAQVATGRAEWVDVSAIFGRRLRQVVLGSVAVGLIATAMAIVLEAATAVGVSFWSALDPEVVDSVSGTRPVQAWSVRIVVWLVLGAALIVALRPQRLPAMRRAALGADGAAVGPAPSRLQLLVLLAAAIGLALTAALAGHADGYSPRALLVCTDTLHVLCMSAWLGGLVALVLVLAIAARRLPARDRTPLMAVVVGRFSWLARIAVTVLLLTGAIQSLALVGSFRALVDTEYGLLVLAKIGLFTLLIGLGAYNQRWALPRLRRLAAAGSEPGRAAGALRQAVALEVGLALVVIAVTSVLVVTEPASAD
jgi:copper transport protein